MNNSIFKDKNILIAGATGTIGIPLVKKLQSLNSNITAVALDDLNNANDLLGKNIKYLKLDLRDYEKCENATKNQDYVFNLTGITIWVAKSITTPSPNNISTCLEISCLYRSNFLCLPFYH